MPKAREVSLCKPGRAVVEECSGRRQLALGRYDFQRSQYESIPRLAPRIRLITTYSLHIFPAVPGEYRRVQHGTLDDFHMEVSHCCRLDFVLVDDSPKSCLSLAVLSIRRRRFTQRGMV